MKTSFPFARIAIVVFAVLLFFSCSFGLEPATRDRDATLSFTVREFVPPVSTGDSRIVSPGTGYLYIRTIGGPVGSSGPLYGPFTLTEGSEFKTSAIPAGKYEGIGVLYATQTLEGLSADINGTKYSFTELMRLSDASFKPLMNNTASGPSALETMLDGYASGELIDNVTVAAGKVTTLSATLLPMTGSSRIDLSSPTGTAIALAGNGDALTRRYISVEGLTLPSGASSAPLSWTVYPPKIGALTLGRMILFDENGTVLKDVASTGAVTKPVTFEVTYGTVKRVYLYAEFQGALLPVSFEAYSGLVLELTLERTSELKGRKVFAGVYAPSSVIIDPTTGDATPIAAPSGIAGFTLDDNGKGSAFVYGLGSSVKMALTSGTWYVSGFIDVNGNYSYLPDGAILSDVDGIVPHKDDLVSSERLVPFTVGTDSLTVNLTPYLTETCSDLVYFVANAGRGTGDGQTMVNARSFRDMFSIFNEPNYTSPLSVYLVEDIMVNSSDAEFGITFDRTGTIMLSSVGSSPHSLRLDHANAIASVKSNTSLYLSDIVIDGYNVERSMPLVDVWGKMVIDVGTTIKGGYNTNADYDGGAITVHGNAELDQIGGSIVGSFGRRGGGVHVIGSSESIIARFYMTGGTITGCSSLEGGGVTLNAYSAMTLAGGTITGCTDSLYAGGVYASASSSLTLQYGSITGCSSTNALAGGVWISNSTSLINSEMLSIIVSGNTGPQWYQEPI